MKKILISIFSIILAVTLTACGSANNSSNNKDLKKLIGPLVVEQLLIIMVGFFDTVMVASVGEAAVSAVSLVDGINILLINIFSRTI